MATKEESSVLRISYVLSTEVTLLRSSGSTYFNNLLFYLSSEWKKRFEGGCSDKFLASNMKYIHLYPFQFVGIPMLNGIVSVDTAQILVI